MGKSNNKKPDLELYVGILGGGEINRESGKRILAEIKSIFSKVNKTNAVQLKPILNETSSGKISKEITKAVDKGLKSAAYEQLSKDIAAAIKLGVEEGYKSGGSKITSPNTGDNSKSSKKPGEPPKKTSGKVRSPAKEADASEARISTAKAAAKEQIALAQRLSEAKIKSDEMKRATDGLANSMANLGDKVSNRSCAAFERETNEVKKLIEKYSDLKTASSRIDKLDKTSIGFIKTDESSGLPEVEKFRAELNLLKEEQQEIENLNMTPKIDSDIMINFLSHLEQVEALAGKASIAVGNLSLDQTMETRWIKLKDRAEAYNQKLGKIVAQNPQLKAELDVLLTSIRNGNKMDFNHLNTEFLKLQARIDEAGASTENYFQKFKKVFEGHIGTGLASTLTMFAKRTLRDMYTNVVAVDDAMTELKKVTDESNAAYDRFLTNAGHKAHELGVTIDDLVNATADFARLGYSMEEASDLSQAAVVYKNVGDGINDISEASESIISTMKAFAIDTSDAMSIVDKFNKTGNEFAISSKGVGDVLRRSAASLSVAGNSIEESIALGTAANSVIQNPEQVGTALKTITMYLRAAKAEAEDAGESTDGMAESVSELRERVKELTATSSNGQGVDIMIDKNTFKSTYDMLSEIAAVWGDIRGGTQAAELLELMGGKRNNNIIVSLLDNWSTAEKVLESLKNSSGSALAENEKYLNSITGKTQQLKSSFQNLSMDVIDTGVVKTAVGLLNSLVNGLDLVVKGISKAADVMGVVPFGIVVTGIGKILSSLGAGIFKTKNFTKELTELNFALRNIENYGKVDDIAKSIYSLSPNQQSAAFAALKLKPDELNNLKKEIARFNEVRSISADGLGDMLNNLKINYQGADGWLNKETQSWITAEAQKVAAINKEKYGIEALNLKEIENILITNEMTKSEAKSVIAAMKGAEVAKVQASSTNLLTASLKGLGTEFAAFMATPEGVILAVAFALILIAKAFDKISDSVDDAAESLSKSMKDLDETNSKLEESDSRLKEIRDRIEEINSKDAITLTDESELELLKKEESQIQRNIASLKIEKAIRETTAKKSALDAYNELSDKIGDGGKAYFLRDFQHGDGAVPIYTDNWAEFVWESLVSSGRESSMSSAKEYFNKSLDIFRDMPLEDWDEKTRSELLNIAQIYQNIIDSIPDPVEEDEIAAVKEATLALSKYNIIIAQTSDNAELLSSGIEEAFKVFDEEGKVVEELSAKTDDEFTQVYNEAMTTGNKYSEFFEFFEDKLKIGWQELLNYVRAYNVETAEIITDSTAVFDMSSYTKKIDDIQEKVKSLNDAKQKLNSGTMTNSEFIDLLQEFPSLAEYAGNTDTLSAAIDNLLDKQPQSLISKLTELKDKVNTDEERKQIDALVASLEKLDSDSTFGGGSFLSISSKLENITDKFNTLSSAMTEFATDGRISIGTITSINDKFSDFDDIGKYSEAIATATSTQEVTDAVEELAKAYLDSKEVIRDLNVEYADVIVNNLKYLGVTNAEDALLSKVLRSREDITSMTVEEADAMAILAQKTGASKEISEKLILVETKLLEIETLRSKLNNQGKVSPVNDLSDLGGFAGSLFGNALLSSQISANEEELNALYAEIEDLVDNVDFDFSSEMFGGADEEFDWIERRITVLGDRIQNTIDQTADYADYRIKNSLLDSAISDISSEITTQQTGYAQYMQKAYEVGLPTDIAAKIQQGSYDISDYSPAMVEMINEYQKWYDKARDCSEAITDLKRQQKELAQQKLDNITEYYEAKTTYYQSVLDLQSSDLSAKESRGEKIDASDYDHEISLTQQQKNLYVNSYNNQVSALNQAVAQGLIAPDSKEWYDAMAAINGTAQSMKDCDEQIAELKEEKKGLRLTDLENESESLSATTEKYEQYIETKKASGKVVTANDYKTVISSKNAEIKKLEETNRELKTLQASTEKGSEKWWEYQHQIENNDKAIQGLKIDIIGLNDDIDNLDTTNLEHLLDLLNSLSSLMDSFKSFSETVGATLTGDQFDASANIIYKTIALENKNVKEALEDIKKAEPSSEKWYDAYNRLLSAYTNIYSLQSEAAKLGQEEAEAIGNLNNIRKQKLDNEAEILELKAGNAQTYTEKNGYLDELTANSKQQYLTDKDTYNNYVNRIKSEKSQIYKSVKNKEARASIKNGEKIDPKIIQKMTDPEEIRAATYWNSLVKGRDKAQQTYKASFENYKSTIRENNAAKIENIMASSEYQQSKYEDAKARVEAKQELRRTRGNSETNSIAKEYINDKIRYEQNRQTSLRKELASAEAFLEENQGKLSTEDIRSLKQKIRDIKHDILESETEEVKLQDELKSVEIKKLTYSGGRIDSKIDKLKNELETKKINDEKLAKSDYNKIIAYDNKRIDNLEAQKEYWIKRQSELTSKDSELYAEYQSNIDSINNEIVSIKSEVVDLKDELWDEVLWKPFEKMEEAIEKSRTALETLASLISDDEAFDSKGNLTEMGIAKLGLLTGSLTEAKKAVEQYSTELAEIDKDRLNGELTKEKYEQERDNIWNNLINSVKDVDSLTDEITSMFSQQAQGELDAMLKVIDVRKEALNRKKEYYDYDKSIKSKSKEIQSLKAEIAALEGVSTAQAKAQKARLQASLSEAEEELDDMQTEHMYKLQVDGLEDLKTNLQDVFDEYMKNLSATLEAQGQVIDDAYALAAANSEVTETIINELARFYGFKVSDIFETEGVQPPAVNAAGGNTNSGNTPDKKATADTAETAVATDAAPKNNGKTQPATNSSTVTQVLGEALTDGAIIANAITDNNNESLLSRIVDTAGAAMGGIIRGVVSTGGFLVNAVSSIIDNVIPDKNDIETSDNNVEVHIDNVVSVDGNVDSTVISDLQDFAEGIVDSVMSKLSKGLIKLGRK